MYINIRLNYLFFLTQSSSSQPSLLFSSEDSIALLGVEYVVPCRLLLVSCFKGTSLLVIELILDQNDKVLPRICQGLNLFLPSILITLVSI